MVHRLWTAQDLLNADFQLTLRHHLVRIRLQINDLRWFTIEERDSPQIIIQVKLNHQSVKTESVL